MRRAGPHPSTPLPKPPLPRPSAVRSPTTASRPRKSTARIDDPVRLYLLQMGCNPLLTRATEVSSAQQNELWRRKFRHTMLANDFILAGAVSLLERVKAGTVRLDRTIEVAVTNTKEKARFLKRLGPNLATLRLIEQEKAKLWMIFADSSTTQPAPLPAGSHSRLNTGGCCSPRGRAGARCRGGWPDSMTCSSGTTKRSATSLPATCGWWFP